MTMEIAKDVVKKNNPKMTIVQSLELPKWYVFALKPNNGDVLMDPYVSVDKKTGKVSGWNPQMDLENFKKAINRGG